jgi:hypothetical protein
MWYGMFHEQDEGCAWKRHSQDTEGCLRQGTHLIFILNSNLLRLFLTNVKGGSGLVFFTGGMGMSPAQRLTYHFSRSWREEPSLSRTAGHWVGGAWD